MSSVFVFLSVCVVCWMVVELANRGKGGESAPGPAQQKPPATDEETELLRRLDQKLDRLENRISNLETLVIESEEQKPYERL